MIDHPQLKNNAKKVATNGEKNCDHKNLPHAVPSFVDDKGIITDEYNALF